MAMLDSMRASKIDKTAKKLSKLTTGLKIGDSKTKLATKLSSGFGAGRLVEGLAAKIGTGRHVKATMASVRLDDMRYDDMALMGDYSSAKISDEMHELGDMKRDLVKMSDALRESIRINQVNVGEVDKLSNFLKTAETNTLSLERLEPENNELKNRLEYTEAELTNKTLWASELESKAHAYKTRFEETYAEFEKSKAKMAEMTETLHDKNQQTAKLGAEINVLHSAKRDVHTKLDAVINAEQAAKTSILGLKNTEQKLMRENTEMQKKIDMLSARSDDDIVRNETLGGSLKSLRLDYTQLKADHLEAVSKLDKAKFEIQTQTTAHSELCQRNDDKIFALTSALEGVKSKNQIEEQMNGYDQLEKAKLKAEAERATRRADQLEGRLGLKTNELEHAHQALNQAQNNYDTLNDKFLELVADMDNLRGDHKKQSDKLDQYSSISGVAVGQSFYEDRSRSPSLKLVPDTKNKD